MIIRKKILDLIETIIIKNKDAKRNDKLLLLEVWKNEGLKLTDEQRDYFLRFCTTPETITRHRRELQQNKDWLFPEEVTKQRSFLGDKYRREL